MIDSNYDLSGLFLTSENQETTNLQSSINLDTFLNDSSVVHLNRSSTQSTTEDTSKYFCHLLPQWYNKTVTFHGSAATDMTHKYERVGLPHNVLLPIKLSKAEIYLWDLYQNKFAVSYPFFCNKENPFLKVVLPLAVYNPDVRCALMVLAGSNELDLPNGQIMLEFDKQKSLLLASTKNLLEDNLIKSSFLQYSIILFLLVTILLFEKINCGSRQKIDNHLLAMKCIFEVVGLTNIGENLMAIFAFKNFLYNDIMNSLAYGRDPILLQLSGYENLISKYPFIELIIDLIKYKNITAKNGKNLITDEVEFLLSERINTIDDFSAVEWFPSFVLDLHYDVKLVDNTVTLARVYKLHLLFYLSDNDMDKKKIAIQINDCISTLPNDCNYNIAVLPQLKSILRYLSKEGLADTYFKRFQLYFNSAKYPVFNPENIFRDFDFLN